MNEPTGKPDARAALLEDLGILSEPALQQSRWIENEPLDNGWIHDFTDVVAVLYDDFDLRDRADADLLRMDDDQFVAVQKLIDEIDAMFERVGDYFTGDYTTAEYMKTPEWPRIVVAAKAAHESMTRGNGLR